MTSSDTSRTPDLYADDQEESFTVEDLAKKARSNIRILADEKWLGFKTFSDRLIARKEEMEHVLDWFMPILDGRLGEHKVMMGPPGQGKSQILKDVTDYIVKEKPANSGIVGPLHLSCENETESSILYQLWHTIDPNDPDIPESRTGHSMAQLVRFVREAMKRQRKTGFSLVCDDLVSPLKIKSLIMHTGKTTNADLNGQIVCVTNNVNFNTQAINKEKPTAQLLDLLPRKSFQIRPYDMDDLAKILVYRAKKAFVPEYRPDMGVINYVAQLATDKPLNGSARYAMTMLLEGAKAAQKKGATVIEPTDILTQFRPTAAAVQADMLKTSLTESQLRWVMMLGYISTRADVTVETGLWEEAMRDLGGLDKAPKLQILRPVDRIILKDMGVLEWEVGGMESRQGKGRTTRWSFMASDLLLTELMEKVPKLQEEFQSMFDSDANEFVRAVMRVGGQSGLNV